MNAIATLLVVVLMGPQAVSTFKSKELGLQFDHPKAWKTSTKKGETSFSIPIEGTKESAQLSVWSEIFKDDPSLWQKAMTDMAAVMKRTVEKQWQEEVLGVPLLMTKVRYSDKGRDMVDLRGLLYTASLNKMHFRLVSPADVYDKMEFEWRGVLQTLRTMSGALPKREDPNNPSTTPLPSKPKPIDHKLEFKPRETKTKVVLAPNITQCEVGGKKWELRVPDGWQVVPQADGFELKHPGLSRSATLILRLEQGNDPPGTALFKRATESLEDFVVVDSRREPPTEFNEAKAAMAYVLRLGKTKDGTLGTLDAAGLKGDIYWLFKYRTQPDTVLAKETPLLLELFAKMSVEPKS